MTTYPLVWRVRRVRPEWFGRRCRIVVHPGGRHGNRLIEFDDGELVVCPGAYLRKVHLPVLHDLRGRLGWELRAAWASGRRVALTLERCDVDRVEGIVTRVSATTAFARVGALHVPLDRVLAIHWASRLGDGSRTGRRGAGRALQHHPGQDVLS